MTNEILYPAGLLDGNSEFFGMADNSYELTGGVVTNENLVEGVFYDLLLAETISNLSVAKALDQLGIENEAVRVQTYYDCNYSAFDSHPDLIDGKTLGRREFIQCDKRGSCEHEGQLCELPFSLSRREADILRNIASGLLDKEICEKLFISQSTLRYHKDRISTKTNTKRKVELTRIALKIGLI